MLRTIVALSVLAPLAASQGDPSEAGSFSRTDRRGSPDQILLIGVAAAAPLDLPNVTGALGLLAPRVVATGTGPTISAALFELRHAPRPPELAELRYQILSRDPRTLALDLSDVMRLPQGDEETSIALRTTPPHPPMDGPAIYYPKVAWITLTLNREPANKAFTRQLTFTDYKGDEKILPIMFTRYSGMTWRGWIDKAGADVLHSLAVTGNRSHWDDVKLKNRAGTTVLDIARFTVMMKYDIDAYRFETGAYVEKIPLIDATLNRVLGGGGSSIDLDDFAATSRKSFGGIVSSMDPVVQLAAADFGMSGSDGKDNHGSNPKFNAQNESLCSEFVSWYYYETGLVIGGQNFRDITSTSKLDPIFRNNGRGYDYNDAQRAWTLAGSSTRYTPQPGDMLARLYDGDFEHSMIVLGWNDATKVMTVINGPWPVTLRQVPIQELEESGYEFRVGRIR